MKQRLLFLLMLFAMPLMATAQNGIPPLQPTGNLTIFSEEGDAFYLIMNGERINSNPQTNVRVELLPQPYYSVKIIFSDTGLVNLTKSYLPIADLDGSLKDVTYRIKADRKKGRKLVYASSIPAVQNYTPQPGMFVRRWGQPEGSPVVVVTVPSGPVPGTRGGYGNNTPPNSGYNNPTPPPAPPPGNGYNNGNGYQNGGNGYNNGGGQQDNPNGCRFAMKPVDFNAAKRTISGISFDETRLTTARSIISSNCLTTDQVIELCQLFSFESNKLDFAKIAYGRVVDPGNFFKVTNIFKFDSNKQELSRYIGGY